MVARKRDSKGKGKGDTVKEIGKIKLARWEGRRRAEKIGRRKSIEKEKEKKGDEKGVKKRNGQDEGTAKTDSLQ